MVLQLGDLPGAAISGQGYYHDEDFSSVISYRREFDGAQIGGVDLSELESDAEIGRSVGGTRSFVRQLRAVFGSKEGREALRDEAAGDDETISGFQVGRPRSLGVGDDSFSVAFSFKVLGVRVTALTAVFRVDRILGSLVLAGSPGERVSVAGIKRLANVMVGRMRQELAPRGTIPPGITGTVLEGQTLSATTGSWKNAPTAFAYRWQRCDAAGATCTDITGATAQTYTLTPADVGFTIRVAVTATNAVGSATATSAPTTVVAPVTPPANTSPPTIAGTPQQGQTLTAAPGTWTGAPTAFAYQWQRCDAAATSCTDIAGATAQTYTLTPADAGFAIRVAVTATNAVGPATAASAPTAVVV